MEIFLKNSVLEISEYFWVFFYCRLNVKKFELKKKKLFILHLNLKRLMECVQ